MEAQAHQHLASASSSPQQHEGGAEPHTKPGSSASSFSRCVRVLRSVSTLRIKGTSLNNSSGWGPSPPSTTSADVQHMQVGTQQGNGEHYTLREEGCFLQWRHATMREH